jgi:pimeloyl-ACP methyl ester carboxylesterase
MTTFSATWTADMIEVAGLRIELVKGGEGPPLLVLHDELGHPGWLRYQDALAALYTLHVPSHPGFGQSQRPDWILSMRDLACWYLDALDELGLQPIPVVGVGLGGWLAAEMALMCPRQFGRLVLVGAPGIKPPRGDIYDLFLVTANEYIAANYYNAKGCEEYQELYGADPTPEQRESWEVAREMASRLSWRPFMHSPSLPYLLRRLRGLPTLLAWGKQDAIVPLSAAEVYQASIPGAELAVFDACGHHPEIEQADAFVQRVLTFLSDT